MLTMTKRSNELTDLEKKIAVSLGHEVDGVSILRFFSKRWKTLRTLIRMRLSKTPLIVFVRSEQAQDKTDS